MVDQFCKKLSRLRSDTSTKRWSGLTRHRAPHKPLLLLSVCDHFAQGTITTNVIEPTPDLVETFNTYWSHIMLAGSSTSMAYPFPRLQNDGIWTLAPAPGVNGPIDIQSITSMAKLRKTVSAAVISDDLFQLLNTPDIREHIRAFLIKTWFADEIQPKLAECAQINLKSWEYSKQILNLAEEAKPFNNDPGKKVRDHAFRKTIVKLYDHRCALCGIRMLTPEGHTAVEAAHVIPWHKSRDDHPTNGMALCRLCHWAFDEGLMSVGKSYEVLVSERVRIDRNLPGHILSLSERRIVRPDDKGFWPGQGNLEYHRKKLFV